ncbi:MAG: CRISPR-associated endonuclease Cas1 [Clostridia bacterium]|nr:CRISPR-associated endonuclease Cas1 [Clostridia bacterium]
MAQLYVSDHKAKVGLKGGRVVIKEKKDLTRSIPLESLEGITIIGNAQITTQCLGECLRRGINIQYYSAKGAYFGKVSSTQHVNTNRQRMQMKLTEDPEFSLGLAKNILAAKINNQIVLLRRYQRTSEQVIEEIDAMKILGKKIDQGTNLPEIIGYEGIIAREYFKGLRKLIRNSDFKFSGRTRQPPKDAFNSMLSLGYTILMNDIYGAIEGRGLNPYFGFIHQDREKHPTLASDLIEEWRAVIVDAVAMSLVNGYEITIHDFYKDDVTKGVFLKKGGLKIFIKKIESKLNSSMRYLSYVDHSLPYRRAIDAQILQLCKGIEEGNPGFYQAITIR